MKGMSWVSRVVLWATVVAASGLLRADGDYDFGDASGALFPTTLSQDGARHLVTPTGPFLGPAGDRPDTELDAWTEGSTTGDDFHASDDENGLVRPLEYPIIGGTFENVFHSAGFSDPVLDGVADAIPTGWSRYETFVGAVREDSEIGSAVGPGGVGDHAVRFARTNHAAGGDVTAIQQPLVFHINWYKTAVLSLDTKVVSHDLEAGGSATPAFEWPVFVEVEYVDTIGSNRVWRHGWYVDPPGDGPRSVDPGLPPYGEYQDTPVTAGVWNHAEFDLRSVLPDAWTVSSIRVGGSGWNYESVVDNVSITAVRPYAVLGGGTPGTLSVQVNGGGGYLDGWVDINTNGVWEDPEERVVSGWKSNGECSIPVTPPNFSGTLKARFRINSQGDVGLTGSAPDGEVEDWSVLVVQTSPNGWDYGDAPDPTYPTVYGSNGARHWAGVPYSGGPYLGLVPPDIEGNGLSDPHAQGDDNAPAAGPDDEDGVTTPILLTRGVPGTVSIRVSGRSGYLEGWVDFDGNGYWDLSDVVVRGEFGVGVHDIPVTAPVGCVLGTVFARFRLNSYGYLDSPLGPSNDGEVEDYEVTIQDPPEPEGPQDYGDAPDAGVGNGYVDYSTLLSDNGARHTIKPAMPWLGLLPPDADTDGLPSLFADGDDVNGTDDEDGVSFPAQPFVVGYTTWIDVTVSDNSSAGGGVVEAWIDWNQDGVWAHPGERVYAGFLPAGGWSFPVTPPTGTLAGWTYARFRVSALGGLAPTGPAPEGEVEDYELLVRSGDWGDAPDSVQALQYPTLSAHYGACHAIVGPSPLCLGSAVDAEADGQPNATADGDDLAGADDEDGVTYTSDLYPGLAASLLVTSSAPGYLSAWLDANADGDWSDEGEQVLADVYLAASPASLAFAVPGGAVPGATYMRFRFSSVSGVSVAGLAPDGEVEDCAVTVLATPTGVDFGDAPASYPVLLAQDGARHICHYTWPDCYALGEVLDWPEADGQPSPMADGDDLLGHMDDEDGVSFPTNSLGDAILVQGSNLNIHVYVGVAPGYPPPTPPWLSAWIDFNGDGDWDDPGEDIAAGYPLALGDNVLSIAAPADSRPGPTYARFRSSSLPIALSYSGLVANGEVEDYRVVICQPAPLTSSDIAITGVVCYPGVGTLLKWACDPALLTKPQACTSLVEAAANPGAWVDLAPPALPQFYWDTGSLTVPNRFYRVVAPNVYP